MDKNEQITETTNMPQDETTIYTTMSINNDETMNSSSESSSISSISSSDPQSLVPEIESTTNSEITSPNTVTDTKSESTTESNPVAESNSTEMDNEESKSQNTLAPSNESTMETESPSRDSVSIVDSFDGANVF